MLRWSTLHKIPIYPYNLLSRTRVGDNIFFVVQHIGHIPVEFLLFDTATETYNKLNCEHQFRGGPLYPGLVSHENIIYMWLYENGDPPSRITLWKMDMKKLKWERIVTTLLIDGCQYDQSVIIGDKMYVLAHKFKTNFIVVNLSTKEISNFNVLGNHYEGSIIVNDNKIYMYQTNGVARTISAIKRVAQQNIDKFVVVHGREIYRRPLTRYNNGTLCVAPYDYSFDTFDFNLWRWNSIGVEKAYRFRHVVEECWIINEKLYVLIEPQNFYDEEPAIKVLELKPKLSTICYMNLVDEVMNEKDEVKRKEIQEKIVKRLSLIEKPIFENMINWRVARPRIFNYDDRWLEGVGWVSDNDF